MATFNYLKGQLSKPTSIGRMSNDQLSLAYNNAINQLSLEEINKVLKNENKQVKTLKDAQAWARKEYRWLFDGDFEEVNNFEYALSPEGIADNLKISIENYDGDRVAAELNNQLYQKIARLTLSQSTPSEPTSEEITAVLNKKKDESKNCNQ